MTNEEMIAKLRDIRERRMEAFAKADSPGKSKWMEEVADSTTLEDVMIIYDAAHMLDDFGKLVLDLHGELVREYTRGIRCSVCGHTTKQSLALGHDCMYDC